MKSTFQNEYNNMLYITPEGYKFRIIQIAGKLARRIVSLLEPNDIVEQGQFI
jgi:phosphatidylserine decarboxylase